MNTIISIEKRDRLVMSILMDIVHYGRERRYPANVDLNLLILDRVVRKAANTIDLFCNPPHIKHLLLLSLTYFVTFLLQKYVDLKINHAKEDLNGHTLVQSVSSHLVEWLRDIMW